VTHKGKTAVVEDAFADVKSLRGSGANTPIRSGSQTPAMSANATPAGSGVEENGIGIKVPAKKKKKPTRNEIKAKEERRRIRKLNWLTFGGPKPEDTDSD
jgi:elongation factor 3